MVKEFKFLTINESKINWEETGLLVDATDVHLLNRALDTTHHFIQTEGVFDVRIKEILIIVMVRLFRNKSLYYDFHEIADKLNDVYNYIGSTAVTRQIQELQANAWTNIDVDAETIQIITERCNWDEV